MIASAILLAATLFAAPPEAIGPPSDGNSSLVYAVTAESRGTSLVIDLGAQDPAPFRDRLTTIMVVGTADAASATLVKFEKRCEELCGETECHHVGRFTASKDGNFQVAFEGGPKIDAVAPVSVTRNALPPAEQIRKWLSKEFRLEAAATTTRTRHRLRWSANDAKGFSLEAEFEDPSMHGRFFSAGTRNPFPTKGCRVDRVTAATTFTTMTCPADAWLYEGSKLIYTETSDGYGDGRMEFLGSFQMNGSQAYLVSVGHKGSAGVCVLAKTATGWEMRCAVHDYATMC